MWDKLQKLFKECGTRYYGDGGTIHHSMNLNIETYKGKVMVVWFRCQPLPFDVHEIDFYRAQELDYMMNKDYIPELHGIEVKDIKR